MRRVLFRFDDPSDVHHHPGTCAATSMRRAACALQGRVAARQG